MTIPVEATDALPVIERCFGPALRAIHLYGSAVAGGLRPQSDVDLLVVTGEPTTPDLRRRLVAGLMAVSGRCPVPPGGRRPIELVVFQMAALAPLADPPRAEFVYGEWLRTGIEAGAVPEPDTNPDFLLLLAQAREQAVPLFGPPPAALLPAIPAPAVRQAIGAALPALVASLAGDERNVLLTLARMWVTLASGGFVSKDAAAGWAIPRVSAGTASRLAQAKAAYLGEVEDRWRASPAATRDAAAELERQVGALLGLSRRSASVPRAGRSAGSRSDPDPARGASPARAARNRPGSRG